MAAVKLPEGNNASDTVRRLKAIDAEFHTAYVKNATIADATIDLATITNATITDATVTGDTNLGGNLDVTGDMVLSGTLELGDNTATYWLLEPNLWSDPSLEMYSDLPTEYVVGSLDNLFLETVSTLELSTIALRGTTLGDITDNGQGFVEFTAEGIAEYTTTTIRSIANGSYSSGIEVLAWSLGSEDSYADVKTITAGAGDATLTVAATATGAGKAYLNLEGADGITVTGEITQDAWTAPTLLNSWVNYDGAAHANAGYYKDPNGIVHIQGMLKNGTTTTGTTIFVLPAGYRPALHMWFAGMTSGDTFLGWKIDSSGNVTIRAGASSTWISMNGISFPTH